jgi:hypothetical protein
MGALISYDYQKCKHMPFERSYAHNINQEWPRKRKRANAQTSNAMLGKEMSVCGWFFVVDDFAWLYRDSVTRKSRDIGCRVKWEIPSSSANKNGCCEWRTGRRRHMETQRNAIVDTIRSTISLSASGNDSNCTKPRVNEKLLHNFWVP